MVVTPIALTDLATALAIGERSHVALVGGGGKTTILHALGRQLHDRFGGRVVLTSTTKMGADQHVGLPLLIGPTTAEVVATSAAGPVMVWSRVDGSKAIGVDPADCDDWFAAVDQVLAEADGSRRRPFKAPREYEPVIPSSATMVVHVIGADALGRVIADQCHRPLRVAALAGCRADQRLTPERAARVMLHERGVMRAVPPRAELAVVLTKVDERTSAAADDLADAVRRLNPTVRFVAVSTHRTG